MGGFLKLEDLLIDFSDTGYEESIVRFLQENDVTVDDFQHVGRCDSQCPHCEAESFSLWQREVGFIQDESTFTFDLNKADDVFYFAIYLCNNCGKWTTDIE